MLISLKNAREFVINGPIKPYVRMTQRGKFVKRDALEYLASKTAIRVQLPCQMEAHGVEMIPRGHPLDVTALFLFPGGFHNKDLDNLVKAVLDAMQSYVFEDDCWVDSLYARRLTLGKEHRTIVWVTPHEGEEVWG